MTPASQPDPGVNPIVRNALAVSVSAKEYRFLHERAQQYPSIHGRLISPEKFEAITRSKNKYNEAAVRAALRVFLGSGLSLKLLEFIAGRITKAPTQEKVRTSLLRSPILRFSAALSLMLLLNRLLHRFFVKLRANLRTDEAKPFRERNPRISKALTSRYAPAVGASLAGLALGICTGNQLRLSIAIYTSTRGLQALYNAMEEKRWLKNKPSWIGGWLLMPVSFAQLFHAFVFDREFVPNWMGPLILKLSPTYLHARPDTLPAEFHWPARTEIVDSIAAIAKLRWPAFVSPILHPAGSVLPAGLQSISAITGPAHPSIPHLSCALLHPSSPSCGTALAHHLLTSASTLGRFFTSVAFAWSALNVKGWLTQPISMINSLSLQILTNTGVLSSSIGLAWGSVCLWNALLPRSVLPTQRFYLSGALAGLPFAWLEIGNNGRHTAAFMSIFRTAVGSAWRAGVKRGLWKGWRGGELWLFVLGWATLGCVLDSRPNALGAGTGKLLAWTRGEGWTVPLEKRRRR
ncbi:hypothetical protein BDW74DRAFT_51891 [Aspergillus multicolor]|uniref:uncharacterized protein n=1 Tax=Aspergillus multicolor TaxID=41759 RepID=UPI003CCCC824